MYAIQLVTSFHHDQNKYSAMTLSQAGAARTLTLTLPTRLGHHMQYRKSLFMVGVLSRQVSGKSRQSLF
jgi:hypothetical protein